MVAKDGSKTGGRKKGSKNKINKDVTEMLNDLGCNPIEGMYRIACLAEEGIPKFTKEGFEYIEPDYALAGQMYKELAQYIAPKRKQIEHTGDTDLTLGLSQEIRVSFVEPPDFED